MYELRQGEDSADRKVLLDNVTSLAWVDADISLDSRDFTIRLIRGVLEKLESIDALIDRHSRNWKLERLSAVDKSILRLCLYEMMYITEIPVAVTINEGIELGKLYGGEGSGQFINGILDAVNKTELKAGED